MVAVKLPIQPANCSGLGRWWALPLIRMMQTTSFFWGNEQRLPCTSRLGSRAEAPHGAPETGLKLDDQDPPRRQMLRCSCSCQPQNIHACGSRCAPNLNMADLGPSLSHPQVVTLLATTQL